jgi:hypothetical protein
MPATRKDAGGVACHEHGAVFASAARAPLTSVASVVEMTGDFTLTLPVMLAVAIATSTSGGLSYGTIYTTKLPRHGQQQDDCRKGKTIRHRQISRTMLSVRPKQEDRSVGRPDRAAAAAVDLCSPAGTMSQ